MAALLVSSGSEANGAKGTAAHVVGVFLMGLDVRAKLEDRVFVVCQFSTREEVSRGVKAGCAVIDRKCIDP